MPRRPYASGTAYPFPLLHSHPLPLGCSQLPPLTESDVERRRRAALLRRGGGDTSPQKGAAQQLWLLYRNHQEIKKSAAYKICGAVERRTALLVKLTLAGRVRNTAGLQ